MNESNYKQAINHSQNETRNAADKAEQCTQNKLQKETTEQNNKASNLNNSLIRKNEVTGKAKILSRYKTCKQKETLKTS